jgi:hypothetical protein
VPRTRGSLVAAIVVSVAAVATTAYTQTPTKVNFAACNAEARAAVKEGTATPTRKDYMRAEAAVKGGTVILDSSDPQLAGITPVGVKDAAYQAVYRTCMRKSGF